MNSAIIFGGIRNHVLEGITKKISCEVKKNDVGVVQITFHRRMVQIWTKTFKNVVFKRWLMLTLKFIEQVLKTFFWRNVKSFSRFNHADILKVMTKDIIDLTYFTKYIRKIIYLVDN